MAKKKKKKPVGETGKKDDPILKPARKIGQIKHESLPVQISDIAPDMEYQMRLNTKNRKLDRSIEEIGLLQPIILWEKRIGKYKYNLISGHCRLESVKNNFRAETIEAIILKGINEKTALRICQDENDARKSWKPIEKAIHCDKLTKIGMTIKEISKHLNTSIDSVKKYKGLLKANEKVINAMNNEEITYSQADKLRRQQKEIQDTLLKMCRKKNLTNNEFNKKLRTLKKQQGENKSTEPNEFEFLPENARVIKCRDGTLEFRLKLHKISKQELFHALMKITDLTGEKE